MTLYRTLLRNVCGLLIGLSFVFHVGCVRMIDGKPPGAWHEAYEPLNHPESEAFISDALKAAVDAFGAPLIPVNEVVLRRSRKTELARKYRVREDFSLTSCIDPTNGVFVIYIGVDPDHKNYYALLGHECAHLINPYITDWYMEGVATVFSEQVCDQLGKEWGSWKRHFMKSRREPYALCYRMMLDLQQAFPERYRALQQFAVPTGYEDWQRIDIDAWIDTLPAARREEALKMIEPHIKGLKRRTSTQYSFTVPHALNKGRY